MTSAAVRLGESGRLEIVRQSPPEDPARFAATLERLRRAAGPGVVEVVEVRNETGTCMLVLAHAGAAVSGPLPGADVARVGASIAAALADLHERGMTHGAVVAEHVLRDAAGTVRLCGLGHGEGAPSDDVAALAALLRSLLASRDSSEAARAVRVVADRCEVTDPAARPSASAVAASLASAAPEARMLTRAVAPIEARGTGAERRERRVLPTGLPRIAVAVVAAVALALVATILFVSRPSPARATTTPRPRRTTTPRATPRTTARATTARRVWPPSPPHVVRANGTWTFGTEDDRVVLADWNCDGIDTPALVQPDGDVYVVDAWTDGARGRLVTTVANVVDVRVERWPSCDFLVLATADGRTVTPTLSGS